SAVWDWLNQTVLVETAKEPASKTRWGPFFEDIPTEHYSDTQINAGTMALYLLHHPKQHPDAGPLVAKILEWTERVLGNHEFDRYGVTGINEQTRYLAPGNSHTARHAAVHLLFNFATAHTMPDGAVRR